MYRENYWQKQSPGQLPLLVSDNGQRQTQESRIMRLIREQLARHRLMLTPERDFSYAGWAERFAIWLDCMNSLVDAAEQARVVNIRVLKPRTGWLGEYYIHWLHLCVYSIRYIK